ncbi:MAG: proton-conducting transporter membrane subunit [Eubacterium sp.]
MPATIWCYTFVALALIGIPPASGFISKWYLAVGMLKSGVSTFSWLGTGGSPCECAAHSRLSASNHDSRIPSGQRL